MTIIAELGADLAALTGKVKGQVVVAYDTASGFVQWHLFVWDGVSAWKDATLPIHTHASGSDGGLLVDIKQAIGNRNIYELFDIPEAVSGVWLTNGGGTGNAFDLHDDTANVARRYQTGTTSTGYHTAIKGGINIDYEQKILWNHVWNLSATNNLYFLIGINGENINAAQNNSPKLAIEWCDGQASANYFVTSASGSARSSSDSTVTITNTMDGMRCLFTPATNAVFKFDTGTSITKSTNLPTANTDGNNVIREGIKNNNGGTSNRSLRIRGLKIIGIIDDTASQWVST
jgi:hypothetical protein